MSDSSYDAFRYDAYAHHGRNLIKAYIDKRKRILGIGPTSFRTLATSATPAAGSAASGSIGTVGILGAGAGGLYTALILDDLGIPYRILEAQDKVGGRLFTYKFKSNLGEPYNYFDVGAMRFPKISSMTRVFHLFAYEPLNTGKIQLKAKLKPFYFVGGGNNNTFFSYNGVTVRQNAMSSAGLDPFLANQVIKDTDATAYIAAGTKKITDDVIAPFATALLDDLKTGGNKGWLNMQKYDHYSTRSYMQLAYKPSSILNIPAQTLPTDVVNWCETFDKSTGWYDRALSETVLEAVAFGWHPEADAPPAQWFCIDGGAYQIADCMAQYIRTRQPSAITLNSRVTGIARNESGMEVTTDYSTKHQFSHVISTIPLPVLRTVDLKKAGLSPMQSNALRELNYGPSVKIGMQFSSAWWTTGTDLNGKPLNIVGGQTYTDRPLRTVVYPSFGNVQAGETTTLIASYCWTEDAERLGALVDKDDKVLINVVLQELADIHNVDLEFLRSQLIECKGWSWSHDPYTMGAFAFFGPGKFESLYTSLTTPAADGHLHFAGEAISVRHAWVEGALDSAWRAVYEMLNFNDAFKDYRANFYKRWGANQEWVNSPNAAAAPTAGTTPKTRKSLPVFKVELPSGTNKPEAIPVDDDLMLQHWALAALSNNQS